VKIRIKIEQGMTVLIESFKEAEKLEKKQLDESFTYQ
jgi:hypothetical protein